MWLADKPRQDSECGSVNGSEACGSGGREKVKRGGWPGCANCSLLLQGGYPHSPSREADRSIRANEDSEQATEFLPCWYVSERTELEAQKFLPSSVPHALKLACHTH